MATVEFEHVRKVYSNGVEAVKGMNLNVGDGEFIVLVGPSGCGKSTLLRVAAGLESVTSGMVRIGERVVNDIQPSERNIAMVFQNYALYPHMTVYGNMAYGLRNARVPKTEIDVAVKRAAEILQLEAFLRRKPRQLSGGQRQRVAMGRAIVRNPDVFLFDEPLSNLDAKLRVQMRVEIKKLQQELETTSLYVTHDQVEAMTMADRLVVMNAGTAEQIGTPMEVYDRPATQFVAGFIGSPAMNFLPGKFSADRDHVVMGKNVSIALSQPAADAAGEIIIGIRPEHIKPTQQGLFAMQVTLAEPLGAETLVHGVVEGTEHDITIRVPGSPAFSKGSTVALELDSNALHFFDATTGARLF